MNLLLGVAAFVSLDATALLRAQQPASIAGEYSGSLSGIPLKLHLVVAANDTLTGKLDSPSQGADGLPVTGISLSGDTLSFEVPSVHGTWKGSFNAATLTLSGTWSQGTPMPLEFTRDALKPSSIDGIWLGSLQIPNGKALRLQMTLHSDATGKEICTVDSLDQGAMGLECGKAAFHDNELTFDIPSVKAFYTGKLSSDGNSLTGTFTQSGPLPLAFLRQKTAATLPAHATPKFDPAIPSVSAINLQAVLTSDLAEALKTGVLSPKTHAGVAIGVIQRGAPYIFTFGTAKPDSIFEIGSISKTFTGLLLAQMIEQQQVTLDEPVRALLPSGAVAKPNGPEITLLDLTTQHSGLPRMPDNLAPADEANPYADYDTKRLYTFLRKHGVAHDSDTPFLYSNLGVGLLGQALANRVATTYGSLLHNQIVFPLGLTDTTIDLSAEQRSRFIPCFDTNHDPVHAWDFMAFAGAGGIRSTAPDMLKYLQAQLHPESLPPRLTSPIAATLPAAIALSHQLRADAGPGMRIAFNWLYDEKSGVYWHNGATGGYTSYAFFNPAADYAAIVLVNIAIGPEGSLADLLGTHIRQRLAGEPAVEIQ